MRRLMLWSTLTVALMLAAVAGLYWAYWGLHARFQPRVVGGDTAAVEALLNDAGWVSDNGGGQPLYVVGWRDCESCLAYQTEEFQPLRTVGMEPRVILVARADRDGLPRSTAGERSTVAELWASQDWTLFQRWTATPSRNWTAAGLPVADGNASRTALVERGRDFQADLEAALRASGMSEIRYPLVIWRDSDGVLMACSCSDARAWAFVRDDLGSGQRRSPDAIPAAAPEPVREAAPMQVEVAPVPYPETTDRPTPVAPPVIENTRPPVETPPARRPRPEARPEPRPTPRPRPRPETRPESRPERPQTRPQTPPRQPLPPSTPRDEDGDTMFF